MTRTFYAACCIALAAAGARADERYEFDRRHMGTDVRFVVYAADRPAAEAAVKAASARVAALEQVMTDYRLDSELMKLCLANDADPGKPRKVSDDLFAVLSVAKEVSTATAGRFDVTVGPLTKLWRTTRREQKLPAPEVLAAAKAKVGPDKMTLDPAAKTVTLTVPGVRLDLGGIGKGFAADAALATLKANGISRALIAIGGDITAADPPPGKDGWVVDVAPVGTGRPRRTLSLANAAVSTSGDLFQHVEIGGVRYSHILDPRTGLGQTGRRSVTVVAKKGVYADSLTKAGCLLPPADAVAAVETFGGAVYLVAKETDAAEEVVQSKGFAAFVR